MTDEPSVPRQQDEQADGAMTPEIAELLLSQPPPPPSIGPFWSVWLLLFGVVLPIITLLVELTTRICTGNFFNPLPTYWHVGLYALIPAFTLLLLFTVGGAVRPPLWLLGALYGMALVVASIYTLLFLPVLPIAVIAITYFGVGFCALSPLLALIGILFVGSYLRNLARQEEFPRLPGWLHGVLLALLVLAVVEASAVLTQVWMRQALSTNAATRARAVQQLRRFGQREVLLRACYERSRASGGLLAGVVAIADSVSTDGMRMVYYRVTGQPFNSVPPPDSLGDRDFLLSDFDFDPDVGGTNVAGRVRGLALASSRLDGSVDAAGGVAYLEWTQEFRNDSDSEREARAQLALPPGGVVSRATLWVNGEPREAVFGPRGHARAAYQQVAVVERRDPLLVTTCAPDRVLVQCFPIPAHGGMKIRLGITAPLQSTRDESRLLLPRIVERNYNVAADLPQHLWVEATAPLVTEIASLKTERAGAAYALRGTMPADAAGTGIRMRGAPARLAWTPDPVQPGAVIRQQPALTRWQPDRVVFVIDSSAGMEAVRKQLGGLHYRFPAHAEFAVIVATDAGYRVAMPPKPMTATTRVDTGIRRCEGGIDNLPALLSGLELAAQARRGAVVWIHGPQPLNDDVSSLRQWWERRPDGPRLYALQAVPGPDRVLEAADGVASVYPVASSGQLADDLSRLYGEWDGRVITWERARVTRPGALAGAAKTSDHLARLWAADQVRALRAAGNPADIEMAIAIARRYHLVTPVTGAVVLETTQQYNDAGLDPLPQGTVPTIPEPEVWLLLAAAALVLLVAAWRKRRACPAA